MTLLELMISIAIVSILLVVVAPNVRDILISNKITSQLNETSAVMQLARHTAIDEQNTAIFCPTQDFASCTSDWTDAKMAFIDLDASGGRNNNEELLASTDVSPEGIDIKGPNGAIQFDRSGAANLNTMLLFCDEDGEARFARGLGLTVSGRVKVSQDTDNDSIHEDLNGVALNCN
ncbi:hypothetical protein GCM10027098_35300 [Bowmanella dokdonensis]